MRAGELRTPLMLDKPTITEGTDGGEEIVWNDSWQVWGKVEVYTGREIVNNMVLDGVDAKITVRDEQPVTARWRVRDMVQALMYNVTAVLPRDGDGNVVLLCRSIEPQQSDGR